MLLNKTERRKRTDPEQQLFSGGWSRNGLTNKLTLEHRLEGDKRLSHVITGEKCVPGKGNNTYNDSKQGASFMCLKRSEGPV